MRHCSVCREQRQHIANKDDMTYMDSIQGYFKSRSFSLTLHKWVQASYQFQMLSKIYSLLTYWQTDQPTGWETDKKSYKPAKKGMEPTTNEHAHPE